MQLQNEQWISSKQICVKLNITNQTFQYHRTKNWMFREADCTDGSKYEVLLTSLLPEQIAKYNQHLILHEHEEHVSFETNLSEKDKEIALAKDSFLRLYFNFAQKSKGSIVAAKKRFIEIFNQGKLYNNIFEKIGEVNFSTIETHWKKLWLETGKDPFSLAPKYPERKSTVTTEEAKILIDYSLTPNNRPIRQCARDARDQMIIKNFHNVKSLQTYVRWIEDFRNKNIDVWVLVREGRKALEDKIIKPVKRDYSQLNVGDVIVADGHKLNFEILDPYTGKYKRMNLILFHDMYSDLPLGWDISLTEDTETITIAFYRAILRLGKIPKIVYLDNGRAFRSQYLNGMEGDLEESGVVGLFERLGCRVTFAKPYNAKAKTVERFFRTFSELEMKLPTYCGTSIANKPPRMLRNEKLHKKIFDKVMENTVIDIWTAHHLIADYFDTYGERVKEKGRLKGKRPLDIFRNGKGPGVDKTLLLFMMMEEKDKPVTNEGIKLFGNTYYHKSLYGLVGMYVTIRYDILNKDFIYVLDHKNNIICKAINDSGVHAAAKELGDETDVQKLNEAMALKNEQYNYTYEKATALLSREMLPAINKKIEQAETLRLIESKKDDEVIPKIKPTSVFSKIKPVLPAANEQSNIFYKKAAEG